MLFLTSSPALRLEIPTECCVDLQQLFGGFLLQRDCPGEKAWFLPRRTPAVGSLTRFEPQPGTPPGLMFSQQALLPACPVVGCLGCRQQRHYRTAPPSALSFSALNGGACRAPGQSKRVSQKAADSIYGHAARPTPAHAGPYRFWPAPDRPRNQRALLSDIRAVPKPGSPARPVRMWHSPPSAPDSPAREPALE